LTDPPPRPEPHSLAAWREAAERSYDWAQAERARSERRRRLRRWLALVITIAVIAVLLAIYLTLR
jgi:type VI protein secretion system component VasF